MPSRSLSVVHYCLHSFKGLDYQIDFLCCTSCSSMNPLHLWHAVMLSSSQDMCINVLLKVVAHEYKTKWHNVLANLHPDFTAFTDSFYTLCSQDQVPA